MTIFEFTLFSCYPENIIIIFFKLNYKKCKIVAFSLVV